MSCLKVKLYLDLNSPPSSPQFDYDRLSNAVLGAMHRTDSYADPTRGSKTAEEAKEDQYRSGGSESEACTV